MERWGVWLALRCAAPGWQAPLPGILERMLASSAGTGAGVLPLWLLLTEPRPLHRSAAYERPKLLLATPPVHCCPVSRPASAPASHTRRLRPLQRAHCEALLVMEVPHSTGMISMI